MRPILFLLPLFDLLLLSGGLVVESAMPAAGWIGPVFFGLSAATVSLWIVLETNGIRQAFARKGAKYGASSGLVVVLGLVAIIGVAVVTSKPRFNKTLDVTRDQLNTLSEQSLKIIERTVERETPVEIQAFISGDAVKTKLSDLLGAYEIANLKANISYIDPQTDPQAAIANKVAGNVAIFKFGDREHRITAFTEEKITNALVNVLKEKTKKVYFTVGHGEGALDNREETGFAIVDTELKNNKYEVAPLSIIEAGEVPQDADMLVIAGPLYDFKSDEIRLVDNYLKQGGAALVMVDALTPAANLNQLMAQYGVKANSDILMLQPDDPRAQYIGQNNAIITEFDELSPVTRDYASKSAVRLILGFTRTLDAIEDNPNSLKVTLAAKSSEVMMRVNGVSSAEDLKEVTEDRVEAGSFPVIAVASGKIAPSTASKDSDGAQKSDGGTGAEGAVSQNETRMVVVGSSHFANNSGAQDKENRDMFMSIAGYLLQDSDFISISPNDATKSTIDVATLSSQILLLALAFIYPFFFLGAGTVNWLVRRKA
jgi:ABC-type uncharacterized transport system involved in gliding motility auxiliary subunit